MISTWQAPIENGKVSNELLVSFDKGHAQRIMISPALFDEANKLRRQTLLIMRQFDQLGWDCFLPDLPGCNESLMPLSAQSLDIWRDAFKAAVSTFKATHVLTIRSGALIAPKDVPSWQYAPLSGTKLLKGMVRARILSSREAGTDEKSEDLMQMGQRNGLTLAGYQIGPKMFEQLVQAEANSGEEQITIAQRDIGGAGLWLRAEADEDNDQASAIAKIVARAAEAAE